MEKGKIKTLPKEGALKRINILTKESKPYFFVSNFEGDEFLLLCGKELMQGGGLFFDFGGITNYRYPVSNEIAIQIKKVYPPDFERYYKAFEIVKRHIAYGNTYLLNLTFASKIDFNTDCKTLEKVFAVSRARYKIWLPGSFVCFSPEPFIRIDRDGKISTYPMKGTIDATLPDAYSKLENDEKEIAEHYTIVDLLRNDLALVANGVKVERFRYFEKINSKNGELWQTSSEITGTLKPEYLFNYGDVLRKMLPAGSISGAPKQKTVSIIKEVEALSRGFYTGVAGFFDGKKLDTAVMIRFIEKRSDGFYYRSGGGIVNASDAKNEYEELIKKIYIPV